jgi:NAD(P)-dependent dehydrogenase (short-subunit alcohol dehydrogenase family)
MAKTHDPRETGPKPPFPPQLQTHPGSVRLMNPPADHGEDNYQGTGKLKARVAIITGGDSGIGRAVAIAFAREGADLVLSFLSEEQADADDTAAVIEKSGAQVVKVAGDIREIETIDKLIPTADSQFGRLGIVVNNAGYQMSHDDIEELSLDELDRTFRTNVFATLLLSHAALKKLPAGGVISNTTSIQAYDQAPN